MTRVSESVTRYPVLAVQPDVLAKRRSVVPLLRHDLLIQYDAPRLMNWDLYDSSITFDDPMTKLSGKLQYRVRSLKS